MNDIKIFTKSEAYDYIMDMLADVEKRTSDIPRYSVNIAYLTGYRAAITNVLAAAKLIAARVED